MGPVSGVELCSECGGELHGKRRDAGTCSGACRQRAYRKRVAAERAAAAGYAEQFPAMAATAARVPVQSSGRCTGGLAAGERRPR